MKSKKAMLLMYPVLLGFILALSLYFFMTLRLQQETAAPLGYDQLKMMEAASKGENILWYTDQSALNSLYQTIHESSLNGGFSSTKCGNYVGYSLWKAEGKEIDACFPDYKKDFNASYSKILDSYLKIYPIKDVLPAENYKIELKTDNGLTVIGNAIKKLSIPFYTVDPGVRKGEYFIRPSFKHAVDYDLNEYESIKESLKKLVAGCEDASDLKKCFKERIEEVNKLWKESYGKASAQIEYKGGKAPSLLQWELDCIQAAQKDASAITAAAQKLYGAMKGAGTDEETLFSVLESCNKAEIELIKKKYKELYEGNILEGDLRSDLSGDELRRALEALSKITAEQKFEGFLEYTVDCKDSLDVDCYCSHELPEGLFQLRKTGESKTEAFSFIDNKEFGYDLSLEFGEDEITFNTKNSFIQKGGKGELSVVTEKPEKECRIRPKRTLKLCVRTNKELPFYDKKTGKVNYKDVVYKLAAEIPDKTPPEPVKNLQLKDSLVAEDSVIIRFEKSPDLDVNYYNIYYEAGDKPLAETDLRRLVPQNVVNFSIRGIPKEYILLNINLDDVQKEKIAKYGFTDAEQQVYYAPLEKGRVYYLSRKEEYLYVFDNPAKKGKGKTELRDGKTYAIAVTPVDLYGNENTRITDAEEGIEASKTVMPLDDLAPDMAELEQPTYDVNEKKIILSWKKPEKNTDGSEADDIAGYKIYKKDANMEAEELILTVTETKDEYAIKIEAPEEAGKHHYAVVAFDDESPANEYKTEAYFKPVQI